MFGHAARLEAVIESMAKGASQEAVEKGFRIASRHTRGRSQEMAELVGQLARTEESLVRQLDRWVREYQGGLTRSTIVARWEQAFAKETRKKVLPLKKQLVKTVKRL